MKILTLSRNRLEIAQSQLTKPLLIIGRSPTCDVILRAPGIEPIHFIIEWLGSGKFDSEQGMWSITDISRSEQNAEGEVLGDEPVVIGDLYFTLTQSKLESSEILGGTILGGMEAKEVRTPELIEFVQVRTDSGAIEEVQHWPVQKRTARPRSMSREFREFKVELPKGGSDQIVNVILTEMPGAELSLSGRKITASDQVALRGHDLLRVRWNARDFYLRFVEKVDSPLIPREFLGSPILRRTTLAGLVLGVLLLTSILLTPKEEEEEVPEPPRIARVEIPATPPPPPPPPVEPVGTPVEPPPPPKPTPVVAKKERKVESEVKAAKPEPKKKEVAVKEKTEIVMPKTNKAPEAVAPKVVKAPKAPVKAGLNSEAPTKNVNQIGLLGALSQKSAKGPGIRADRLMNEAVIKESVTAPNDAQVLIKTPTAGVLGTGSSGDPRSRLGEKSLGSASTTLSGANEANPRSTGLIARKGGDTGFRIGSGGDENRAGAEDGRGSLGGPDVGEYSVVGGGLDRETVRRIINSYKSQIRTCYERALIANPNFEGRISYKWSITPAGVVVSAHIHKESIESSSLKACVLEVIQGMKFPVATNGLPTTVIYPFVFQGKR